MSDSWLRPFEDALPSDTIVMPVVAYRMWYVPLQPILQLWSICGAKWKPCEKLVAECRNHMSCVCSDDFWTTTKREPEDPFTYSCAAGIYAWKTFDQSFEMYMDAMERMDGLIAEEPLTNRYAIGKVYLWGRVIECEKGFRAQYAYPATIFRTAENSDSLAAMYRVPCEALKYNNRYPDEPRLCP